eukprot:11985320-Ditylum_brightwellii.AAC.1
MALEDINWPAIRAFTSKCGYNCNMAYAICNGPSHLGGSKFTLLYHLQGIQQIQNFHQSGWQTSLPRDTTSVLPYVESHWLPSLCSYLGAY